MDVEVFVPKNHLCRIIHQAVEMMDDSSLLSLPTGRGRPPYHPKMMVINTVKGFIPLEKLTNSNKSFIPSGYQVITT